MSIFKEKHYANINGNIDYENLIENYKLVFKEQFNSFIINEISNIKNTNINFLLSFGDYTSSIQDKHNSIIMNFLSTNNIVDHNIRTSSGLIAPLSTLLKSCLVIEKQEMQESLINEIKRHNKKIQEEI